MKLYRLLTGSLFMVLTLVLATSATAQPVKPIETYKISGVHDVHTRNIIARTGADIFEVGHDYVLVGATPAEAAALAKAGFTLVKISTQEQFENLFPPADSNYHDYAEMLAELQQAAPSSSRCTRSPPHRAASIRRTK